jgi:5-(carboxyamino)imidazole ribonucleotide synthase
MSPDAFPLDPLPPGSTIGIVGGGQLGRMLALAAARLGFDIAILAPKAGSPAARVAAHEIVANYDDLDALRALARVSDVVTFEFENLSGPALAALAADGVAVYPPARALEISQDRVLEKTFLRELGVETTPFLAVHDRRELTDALNALGAPALLKTRRDGYDGKGQAWIRTEAEADAAFGALEGRPLVLEAHAAFVREISIIGARGRNGEIALYPPGVNEHEAGVLRVSRAPGDIPEEETQAAYAITRKILSALEYVGVIGVEFFVLDGGRLLVNEFAPRVHNTGHWTLDGCEVDQFEQHLRAVAGWPLGPTRALAKVEMRNLLGSEADDWRTLCEDPGARIWIYGKGVGAGRRKMGHVNRLRQILTD